MEVTVLLFRKQELAKSICNPNLNSHHYTRCLKWKSKETVCPLVCIPQAILQMNSCVFSFIASKGEKIVLHKALLMGDGTGRKQDCEAMRTPII